MGDGAGEVVLLRGGEGDDVLDFVERHGGRVLSGGRSEVGGDVMGDGGCRVES